MDRHLEQRIFDIEILIGDLLRSQFSLHEKVDQIMIDTSAALAAVQKENSDNASLRALAGQLHDLLVTVSQQLATAIANQDPAALAQVQNDLNQIATLANTDDAATQAAIAANQPPATGAGPTQAAPQAPPAAQSPAQPLPGTQNPS